jgi:hypothetical protein
LCDVTLACPKASDADCPSAAAGHVTVRAHRVILSACSLFFRDLLKSLSSSPGPMLIYLSGIECDDLVANL